jgi:energy-coupling factor transporter ATP-binding protein EcfA2
MNGDDRFSGLVADLERWSGLYPGWPPADAVSRQWSEVGPRLATAVADLGRPLVVGVLGGTGTGKSTLVNALAGRNVTEASDVARPTTVRPVVVVSATAEIDWFPVEAIGAAVVRTDAAAVAEIVLIDCPDPDTQAIGSDSHACDGGQQDGGEGGGNRDRLEQILPQCDVLMVVSTAQKYRSFSVSRELETFAPGRPLLFVQTHASRDPDIREDWTRDLQRQGYVVPLIYRVDALSAFRASERGTPHEASFVELQDAIKGELACRAAARIRRNGGLELAGWFLDRGGEQLQPIQRAVADFRSGIHRETQRLESLMAEGIARQVRMARTGWRRLVAHELEQQWQAGAFGWFLQLVANVAAWLPKSRRQVSGLVGRALAGQVPGLTTSEASGGGLQEDPLDEALGLDGAEVEQSRSILVGLARRAALQPPLIQAARLPAGDDGEEVFKALANGQRWLAAGIKQVAASCRARIGTRWLPLAFEVLFDAVLVAVVTRAAWDFFHGRLWLGESRGGMLTEAVIWIVLWGLLLRQAAILWAARRLDRDITTLAASLRDAELVEPLLADLEQAAVQAEAWIKQQQHLKQTWAALVSSEPTSKTLAHLGRMSESPACHR